MKTCPNCNASVIDTAKFCHKCRFNIKKYEDEKSSEVLYCTECGAELQADASFCTECGADIVGDSQGASSDTMAGFNFDGLTQLSGLANEQMYQQNGLVVENGVLTGYTGKKRSVTIYGSIEEVYDSAFEGNQIVSCVKIEEGVKVLGRKAFASCSSLVEISIPSSCKMIYTDTFKNTSIQTLIMPEYREKLVLACLSDVAQKNIDKIEISDAINERDDGVAINIELIENNVKKVIKAEEERIALEKKKEEMRREAERKRKEQEEAMAIYSRYSPGANISMGAYNHGVQAQDIKWIVLERNGDKALVISKYIIDRQKFNEISENTCWERSTIRKWLNEQFYNIAFSNQEKSKILTTTVKNSPNPQHGTSSGNDTLDKIFLLSVDEVKKYFKADSDTKCQVTLFAKNKGAYCDGAYFGYWWLRTTGQYVQNASYVFYTGGVSLMGYDASGMIFGVRPAMWISLQ